MRRNLKKSVACMMATAMTACSAVGAAMPIAVFAQEEEYN